MTFVTCFLNFQLIDLAFRYMLTSRRKFSRDVSLSSRMQIDQLDAGLRSVAGAEEIISKICGKRAVDRLILGHNDLQDEGCSVLFSFLRSPTGQQYRILHISLNSNGIGNRGLLEISEYLKGNRRLRELFVQNNNFVGDAAAAISFAKALNTSHLTLLSLTTNRTLGDEFAEHFLGNLEAPHLRELHLSATGMTPASAHHIAGYLTSPGCKLHAFRCNGNSLGLKGVRIIIRAVQKHNFNLLTLELYANQLSESDPESASNGDFVDSEDESDSTPLLTGSAPPNDWGVSERILKGLIFRNTILKKAVEEEALQLLRYSRAVLLHSGSPSQSRTETRTPPPPASSMTFTALPPELQLSIFSFLAPTLSPAQLVRIYQYASSPHTLPHLLPRLQPLLSSRVHGSNSLCYPDPSLLGFGGVKVWPLNNSSGSTAGERCSDHQCMGSSVLCQRDKERAQLLEAIGCTAYEKHTVCSVY